MEKFILYVGLNDKDTKTQLVTTPNAKRIVNQIVGDCSIQEITGFYTHENGEKVEENTLKVEKLFSDDASVRMMCGELKKELNQESIALEKVMTNSILI